jgi:hypothetical protein
MWVRLVLGLEKVQRRWKGEGERGGGQGVGLFMVLGQFAGSIPDHSTHSHAHTHK